MIFFSTKQTFIILVNRKCAVISNFMRLDTRGFISANTLL